MAAGNLGFIHLSPEDLLLSFEADGPVNVQITQSGEGDFSDNNIIQQVANCLDFPGGVLGCYGYLFTGHSKTVSCVPLDDKFWVFNSHNVDCNNRVVLSAAKGTACLFRCLSAQAAAKCLLSDHRRQCGYWQLYLVQLELSLNN